MIESGDKSQDDLAYKVLEKELKHQQREKSLKRILWRREIVLQNIRFPAKLNMHIGNDVACKRGTEIIDVEHR